MTVPSYEEFDKAVDIACEVIERSSDSAGYFFYGWLDDNERDADRHNGELIAKAQSNSDVYDALCRQIADEIRSNQTIPISLMEFACCVLEGSIKRPRGKRRSDQKYRTMVINAICEADRQTSLFLSRNDESHYQMSVLDAVVKAIHKTHGKNITYSTLKREFYQSAREQLKLDQHSDFSWPDVGGNN